MSSTTRKNAVSNIAARKPDLDIAKPANVTEIYGENAFTLKTMKEILPKAIYKKLRDTIKKGKRLDSEIADVVAFLKACTGTYQGKPLAGGPADRQAGEPR